MDAAWRVRFEDDVRIFLAEKRISGIEVEVTDELRLLVAASAVTLSVGWPDHEWDELAEVLLYPDDFDRDYSFGGDELSGQTHPEGTVILSAPSLAESFEYPDDAFHVGLHEFAHLLDLDRSHFGGIPAGLGEAAAREWTLVAEREMERLRKEGDAPKRRRLKLRDNQSASIRTARGIRWSSWRWRSRRSSRSRSACAGSTRRCTACCPRTSVRIRRPGTTRAAYASKPSLSWCARPSPVALRRRRLL
jgi:hypothetical protein